MYSQNDYRVYLEHKWTWPGGKNSKEYNSWYYQNHKDKWSKDKNSDETVDTTYDARDKKEWSKDKIYNKVADTVSDAKKWAWENLGLSERAAKKERENTINKLGNSSSLIDKGMSQLSKIGYDDLVREYYSTPLGKVERYIDAGKAAIQAFTDYLDKY